MTLYLYDGSELTLEQLSSKLVEEIIILRQTTLDKFTRNSSGVSRVYQENLVAANRYKSGSILPMANGMTPTEYLTGLGAPLGFHADQFANYILYENNRLGLIAYDVEKGYLDGKALFMSSQDGNAMITFMNDYKAKCAAVQGA